MTQSGPDLLLLLLLRTMRFRYSEPKLPVTTAGSAPVKTACAPRRSKLWSEVLCRPLQLATNANANSHGISTLGPSAIRGLATEASAMPPVARAKKVEDLQTARPTIVRYQDSRGIGQ